jgi:hypothetical protein
VLLFIDASAKPQGLEVLLQEEKQAIPMLQIAMKSVFFILNIFKS